MHIDTSNFFIASAFNLHYNISEYLAYFVDFIIQHQIKPFCYKFVIRMLHEQGRKMELSKSIRALTSIFLLIQVVSSFSACERKPYYQADTRGIHIDPIQIDRYEEVLFAINPFILREEIDPYIETFYFFLGDEIDDPASQQRLFDYITDPLIKELYLDSREVWSDLSELEASLTKAFHFYKAHFPEETIPKLYTYISGLDHQLPIKYAEGHLVIGIDMYLGRDYHNYKKIGVPLYQTISMEPGYVLPDVIRIIGEKHLQQSTSIPESFLEYMIYEGKLLYFMDCMLPQVADSLKIRYTADQLGWMQQNRGRVWSYYLENEFLYSTDRQMINKFVGDAPFTAAFSRDSAPRTASWIGWQIVREYMKRNQDVSLSELLNDNDAGKILHESRFRGR
jgi:hypothetical protein